MSLDKESFDDEDEENENDNDQDDDYTEDEPAKKKRGRKKKIDSVNVGRAKKSRKKRADSSDFEQPPEQIRTVSEILAKKTKAPAQERVSKELHEINERIIQLVQVKNMGMATTEQEKQLKKLLVEQKKKSNDLKRLKAEQAAKKRYREVKKVFRTKTKSIRI